MPLFQTETVPLNDSDREQLSDELVQAQLELDALRDEKRRIVSVFGTKIKALEQRTLRLATELNEGEHEVKFEVVEEPDDARFMMRIVRKDTGREVSVRPMTEVERTEAQRRKQVDMFEGGDTERPPPPPKGRGRTAKKKP